MKNHTHTSWLLKGAKDGSVLHSDGAELLTTAAGGQLETKLLLFGAL